MCVEPDDITVLERQIQTVDVNSVINDCQPSYSEYAKLQYIDVKISDEYHSNVKVMSALCDSGAEMSVLRAKSKVTGYCW